MCLCMCGAVWMMCSASFPLTHFSLDMIAMASIHILAFLNPVTSRVFPLPRGSAPLSRSLLIVLSLRVTSLLEKNLSLQSTSQVTQHSWIQPIKLLRRMSCLSGFYDKAQMEWHTHTNTQADPQELVHIESDSWFNGIFTSYIFPLALLFLFAL